MNNAFLSWKLSWNCCLWLLGLYFINVQTILVILSKCFRIKQLLMNWLMFQYLTSPWRLLNSPICNYRFKLCIFFFGTCVCKDELAWIFFVWKDWQWFNICLLFSQIVFMQRFGSHLSFSLFVFYILFFSLWSILSFDFCFFFSIYVFPLVVLGAS